MKRAFFTAAFFLLLGLFAAGTGFSQEAPKTALGSAYFSQIFSEKVLTVSREADGIIPGSLRTVLIQASGIRSQNSFALVRIVFDAGIKRIRVTKGPLPELDGSLTTLDCQTSAGRVLIEGAIEDTEGQDPTQEMAGLKITSNGNTVRNCHITGFKGPGILVQGNRNLIEYNTLGYHKDSPEASVDTSPLFGEPKTNQGAGLLINGGSNENTVQNNEFIANTVNGIQISPAAGTANKIAFNLFSKNSGKPIKVLDSPHASVRPQITKVSKQGEDFVIEGNAEPGAEIQVYLAGKDENEVGMNVIPGVKSSGEHFTLLTKSKGFIPNQTRLVALAQGSNRNTSEFSSPILIPIPGAVSTGAPEPEASKPEIASRDEAKKAPAVEIPEDSSAEDAEELEIDVTEHPTEPKKSVTPAGATKAEAKPAEVETQINVRGAGEKGGEPDSGAATPKQHEVSALGI